MIITLLFTPKHPVRELLRHTLLHECSLQECDCRSILHVSISFLKNLVFVNPINTSCKSVVTLKLQRPHDCGVCWPLILVHVREGIFSSYKSSPSSVFLTPPNTHALSLKVCCNMIFARFWNCPKPLQIYPFHFMRVKLKELIIVFIILIVIHIFIQVLIW